MSALPSKREFLSLNINPVTSKPFAIFPSRGRFSAEAEAFAAANSDKFSETVAVAKAPKAPKAAGTPKPVTTVKAENGAVRAAAALARREAKAAAKAAKPTISQVRAAAPSPLDMPKRKQTVGYVIERNNLIALTSCARADKGGCGKTVARCGCPTGPKAAHYLDAGVALTPLLLEKPVV